MSYTAADGLPPPASSSLDGQPLDDDQVDDGVVCTASKSNNRDKYRRYNRRSRSTDKHCTDSRSPSRDYYTKRRRRDRSRHRRSRSRSRSTSRRRHYERRRRRDGRKSRRTKSRSRSRHSSRSRSRRSRSRDYYSSRSRCCRYNGSCSCSRSSSSTYSDRDTSSLYRKYIREVPKDQNYIRKVYAKHDDVPVQENSFKNDGSFLEMFKKMQEDKAAEEKKDEPVPTAAAAAASIGEGGVKKTIPIFGKRRGGRVLKTGLVQKVKSCTEVEEEPKDAWSVYMKEVKRYKEACCDDDSKTRPLVK